MHSTVVDLPAPLGPMMPKISPCSTMNETPRAEALGPPVWDRGSVRSCPVGLGVLTGEISPGLVDEVIERAGCREKRRRRSVMRWPADGLRHPDGAGLATSSALTRARQRLGARPLALLSGLRCGPLAAGGTPGAFAFGLRLAAWDGTGIDAAGTPADAAAFGGVQGGGPQLRLLALIECGTHALIGAVFGGVARASEQKRARWLLPAPGPGMLLLADRNFPGWELQGLAAGTGADLAWRIKKNLVLAPLQVLADGSFLPVMPTPAENNRLGQARAAGRTPPGPPEGHIVRIIEYTVTVRAAGGATRIELFRLVTTLLDHQLAPAAELAALYHERWESENGYAELKTRLRGAAFILRSRSPELVSQEMFAFLTVYQALCALETDAARQAGIDPDRISFTVTVRVARDHASSHAIITPHSLDVARRQAIGDLLSDLLPRRRDRQYERIRKQPKNNFPPLKRGQERLPSRVTYKIKVTPRTSSPAQTP
jgi:Transposase DDE domain